MPWVTVTVPRIRSGTTTYEKGDRINLSRKEAERYAAHGWVTADYDDGEADEAEPTARKDN